jgi:hypothetical protein
LKKLLLFVTILFFALPLRVRAQAAVSLDRVEVLMAQGRILQARQTLEAWWKGEGVEASRIEWQRSIWLRGKLTVDPSMAELDYRRLVVEYPGGPYSDDALLRLAQAAEEGGRLRQADSHLNKLIQDYPTSPLRPEALRWVREHADQVASLPEESPPPRAPPPDPREEEGEGDFAVQLGAFRSLDRARALAVQAEEAGYRVRLVRTPGNDLARVRVGRFLSREEVDAFARTLRQSGFELTIATDAGMEERIGLHPAPHHTRGPPGLVPFGP